MMEFKSLLELRTKIKSKKPNFIRQDYQRRKRLGRKLKWRKPKGIHSKIRHHFKGRRKMPSPGYKSPRKIKNLHASGLKTIAIFSVDDLKKIKRESEGIIISKNVGMKKRLEIFKKAKETNISILNLNVDEQIKKIEDLISSKKKSEIKEIIKEDAKKETEVKGLVTKVPEKLSEEDKKTVEKKGKHKILTKKT